MKNVVAKKETFNLALHATKNVAILYTIGFFLSLTGALTFLTAQLANAMTSGKALFTVRKRADAWSLVRLKYQNPVSLLTRQLTELNQDSVTCSRIQVQRLRACRRR